MSRIKQQYLDMLENVFNTLENHNDILLETEKGYRNQLREFIIFQKEENKKAHDYSIQAMKKYRSTPEGLEASRKSARESLARRRARERSEKFDTNETGYSTKQ